MPLDFSVELKEQYSHLYSEETLEALDNNGAFDDGVLKFEEALEVLDKDKSGGLSLEEMYSSGIPQDGFDISNSNLVPMLFSDETIARLEENGALDDNILTSDEIFLAQDTDGNGELTIEEHEAGRSNQRDLYKELLPEEVFGLLDQLNAFDDNYVSSEEVVMAQLLDGALVEGNEGGLSLDIQKFSENLEDIPESTVFKFGDLEFTASELIFLLADEILRKEKGQGFSDIISSILEDVQNMMQNKAIEVV